MQRAYWDRVAPGYGALYRNGWSSREDAAVVARLSVWLDSSAKTVLDLGCGVGLGHDLIEQALGRPFTYEGVDISEAMLNITRGRFASAQLVETEMTDLHDFHEDAFDVVTAFFATASYAEDIGKLLTVVARVLRPSGIAYLSFLGRWSLRRLIRGRIRTLERYHTRHEREVPPPLVWAYTRSDISHAVARVPALQLLRLEGQGFLSGVAENAAAWNLSVAIDRRAPMFSHLLEVVVRKEGAV
jgi:SAM-dependent methyltransferase